MADEPMAASRDDRCVRFLQQVLPQLGYRWPGFRKVRRQVCRRIVQRVAELGLDGFEDYREHLLQHSGERHVLDRLCRITISRFFRDRHLWRVLGDEALPASIRQLTSPEAPPGTLRAWSAGCASGEEAYSLSLLWSHRLAPRFPAIAEGRLRLRVLATDVDLHMLVRARRGVYPRSCLRELPEQWLAEDFREVSPGDRDPELHLSPQAREPVRLAAHDLRSEPPRGPFHLILCRNLAFTYFSTPVQRRVLGHLLSRLAPGGLMALGGHEEMPGLHGVNAEGEEEDEPPDGGRRDTLARLLPWPGERRLLRWAPGAGAGSDG